MRRNAMFHQKILKTDEFMKIILMLIAIFLRILVA